MKKNLILTGMMGAGKSTIGKKLANKLLLSFVDVDKVIEKYEGSTIDIIFKNKGENYFRTIENKITLKELKKSKSVISLGGGAFQNSTIRKYVKKTCVSFWLDVDLDILVKRLERSKKRPLLLKKDLFETINKIYLERKKTYSEADYKIKCKNLKPEIIINKILKLYENSRNKV